MTDEEASKLVSYALYQNSDKGDIKGVQLNVSANLFPGFNLSTNYAYTYARTKSGSEWTPLERSIRHTATIAANYHHVWGKYGLDVNLNGRLQSKTYYPGYEDAPGYGIWNLYTTHTFNVAKWVLLEPSIGIDNIFNGCFWSHPSVSTISSTVWIAVSILRRASMPSTAQARCW